MKKVSCLLSVVFLIVSLFSGISINTVLADDTSVLLEELTFDETPVVSDISENINPNILFEQNFEGENVEANGKIGGFEGWGAALSCVEDNGGKALKVRGWGAAGHSAWGVEALEAGKIYKLSFKAKGVFSDVSLNLCGDGLGLTNDDGVIINDKVGMGAFSSDDWVDKEFYFSPRVTGHLVEDPGLMYQILFLADGNRGEGVTVDDIKLEKVDSISTPTPEPYVEPKGNIIYNGIFEDPDGEGPENETAGWNDWNCGVFENGMFITRAGNGGTMHTDIMGVAGYEGKKFILRAKVQLLAAETNPDFTGLKFKFNVTGKGEDGKVYENEKFVVTLDDSKFPEGVGSWIQIEEEVSFQTADECIWNTGDGNDRTTKFVAEKFTFGFWAHDGQYAIDNISLVPVVGTNTVAPTPETFVPATDSPATEDPVINVQTNKNVVIYTPVSGIQEMPENNLVDNGGFDFYIGGTEAADRYHLPWWTYEGLEITGEDYITMGENEFSTTPEGYSLKCDMKNLPQDGIAIAGSMLNLEDFSTEQTLKFTFYMKCIGDSAAEELSTINIYGMKSDSERELDTKFTDPVAAYSHQTPGVQDGWVRVDCYIQREDMAYAGPMMLHVMFFKGPNRNADNIYYIDGISAEIIPEEDVPEVEFEEETQVPTDEPGTEETPVPSDVPSATPGTEEPIIGEPVINVQPNKNIVIYTPVSGLQEMPEYNMVSNGGFDSYIGQDSDKIILAWWYQDGLEVTSEDYITMGKNNFTSTVEGYSLKCDMKSLPQNGSATAGSVIYLNDFPTEEALKFTFYMKCVGEAAADELSSVSISGVVSDTQRELDLSFDDSLAVYNHLTPGALDGWVRVEHYIKRENIACIGPIEVQISFKKGNDKNADNIYYIDGVSAEIIPLEDVPEVEFEEETQVPTDEPGTEETPVPSAGPSATPGTEDPSISPTPGTETPTVSESPVVSETPIPIDPDPVVKMKLAKPVIKKIKSTAKKTVKVTLKKKIPGAKKFKVKVATKKSFKKAKTVKVKAKKVFKVKHKLLKKGKKLYFKVQALKTATKKASKFSKAKAYKIKK